MGCVDLQVCRAARRFSTNAAASIRSTAAVPAHAVRAAPAPHAHLVDATRRRRAVLSFGATVDAIAIAAAVAAPSVIIAAGCFSVAVRMSASVADAIGRSPLR